jgi:DNA-directed RNA polymerase specialized sigma24 family protein
MPRIATENEFLSWIAKHHGKTKAMAFWERFSGEPNLYIPKYREQSLDQLDLFTSNPLQALPGEALQWIAAHISHEAALDFWRAFDKLPTYIPVYRPEIDPLTDRIAELDLQGLSTREIARATGTHIRVVQGRLSGKTKRKQHLRLPA